MELVQEKEERERRMNREGKGKEKKRFYHTMGRRDILARGETVTALHEVHHCRSDTTVRLSSRTSESQGGLIKARISGFTSGL